MSFGDRLQRLQSHKPQSFSFVSWWLFLVVYLLARLLMAFYMTTGVFAATSGVPLDLGSSHISSAHFQLLRSGQPVQDEDGYVLFDPRESVIVSARGLRENRGNIEAQVAERCREGRSSATVVVDLELGALYKDLVHILDWAVSLDAKDESCAIRVVVAGTPRINRGGSTSN